MSVLTKLKRAIVGAVFAALPWVASAQFVVTAQQGSVSVGSTSKQSQDLTSLSLKVIDSSGAGALLTSSLTSSYIGVQTEVGLPPNPGPGGLSVGYSSPSVSINYRVEFNVLTDTPVVLGDLPDGTYRNWLPGVSMSHLGEDGVWAAVALQNLRALSAGQWRLSAFAFPMSASYFAQGRFNITAVPEPSTNVLMALGLMAMAGLNRRRSVAVVHRLRNQGPHGLV